MTFFSDLPCKRVFFYIWASWSIALLLCLIHLFLYKHLTAFHFCLARGRKLSNLGNWHTLQYDIKAYSFIFDIQTVYTSWESYAFGSSVLILIISSAYLVI